jgi:hypothetical protein
MRTEMLFSHGADSDMSLIDPQSSASRPTLQAARGFSLCGLSDRSSKKRTERRNKFPGAP